MRYLTDRKRVVGLGSARSGTDHHWFMIVTAVALTGLVPLFIFTLGGAIGGSHAEVTEYFARPFPAIVAALTIVAGFIHFKAGVQTLIEDYVHGFARKALIIFTICLSYTAAGVGLFAIARLAL